MSTTAGCGARPVDGSVTVPARLKPLAPMRTDSSPGSENAEMRDAAEATSSRAISSVCAGTLSRTKAPLVSVHRLAVTSAPGLRNVSV